MDALHDACLVTAFTLLIAASSTATIQGTPCQDEAAGVNGTCAVDCPWAQDSTKVCGYLNTKPILCCPRFSVIEETDEQPFQNRAVKHDNALSLLPITQCGRNPKALITNGTEAGLGDYPWLALIKIIISQTKYGMCGGSLISNRYVLTAAHCFNDQRSPRSVKVLLGEHRLNVDPDCDDNDVCADKPQVFRAEKLIIHHAYSERTNANDIALIRLNREVAFTKWIKPICLPVNSKIADLNLNRRYLFAAGWGDTAYEGSSSNVKMWVTVQVVPLDRCRKVFPEVTSKQLCAGGGSDHKDTCQGDSGGPLMGIVGATRKGKRVQALGIVSYGGNGCGDPGVPGVYTRVGQYMPWLLASLER